MNPWEYYKRRICVKCNFHKMKTTLEYSLWSKCVCIIYREELPAKLTIFYVYVSACGKGLLTDHLFAQIIMESAAPFSLRVTVLLQRLQMIVAICCRQYWCQVFGQCAFVLKILPMIFMKLYLFLMFLNIFDLISVHFCKLPIITQQ